MTCSVLLRLSQSSTDCGPCMSLAPTPAEANADSDIDLLVDLTGTNIRSLFALGSVYCDLESALGKSIDLIPVSALEQTSKSTSDDLFRNAVQTERVRIYDAAS